MSTRIAIVGSSPYRAAIVCAIAALDAHVIETPPEPKPMLIQNFHADMDYDARAIRIRNIEPWQEKHKRNRGRR